MLNIKYNKVFMLALLLILILYLACNKTNIEGFHNHPYILELGYPSRTYQPTRNMSYDLRCEPIIPKKNYYFMSSEIEPQYRLRCLHI